MLDLDIDPKLAWALRHRGRFPIDVNKASRDELLRIPGLGAKTVDRLVLARRHRTPSAAELALHQRDNALVTRVALRSAQRIYSLVGAKAGNPEHPVSRAKRDVEMVSHHVTLNWRQSAVQYLAAATQAQEPS